MLPALRRSTLLLPLLALGCDEPLRGGVGPPAALRRVAGHGQQDTVGATLAESLAVRVVDRAGNPVPSVTVTWGHAATAGIVEPPTSITNGDGIARAAWTLGFIPGPQTAFATVDGIDDRLTFAAQVLAVTRSGPLDWTLTHRSVARPAAPIVGIAGSNASDVFATSADGRVYWFDGLGWIPLLANPAPGTLTAMWGPSSTAVFATGVLPVSGDGFVAAFFGQGWHLAYQDTSGEMSAIHGTSSADIWAVGRAIAHYDGASWTRWAAPAAPLRAVWAAAPGIAFAGDEHGTLYRLDGSVTPIGTPTGAAIRAIAGTSVDDVYAGDATGNVLRWDGLRWTVATTIGTSPVRAIWASGPSNVWAAGDAFAHYDGLAWTTLVPDDALGTGVVGMWGSDGANGWAVTDSMRLKHYDGTYWREHWDTPIAFSAVWGSSTGNVWICGGQGTVQRLDGQQWATERLPGWQACDDLDGFGDSLAIATAGTTSAYRFNGIGWDRTTAATVTRSGVWVHSSGIAFAPGGPGMILRYDGTNWSGTATGTGAQLRAVWGSAPDDVWAGGDGGTLLHYDGRVWQAAASGTAGVIRRLWGSDRAHVFALADQGSGGSRILRYDGSAWSAMHDASTRLLALHGRTSADVFAAGEDGVMLRYDGSAWRSETTGVTETLTDLWASPEGDVFAVGSAALILRGRRHVR